MQRDDGNYFADGRLVHKSPEKAGAGSGVSITIGFPVCQLSEWVGDEAAQVIADALNAARSPAPEGPTSQVPVGDIIGKGGPLPHLVVNPTDEQRQLGIDSGMHDLGELRLVWAPVCELYLAAHPTPQTDPRDELLRECRDALLAAQRFIGTEYEMFADDGELLAHEARPTYEQVTATLMKLREAVGDD